VAERFRATTGVRPLLDVADTGSSILVDARHYWCHTGLRMRGGLYYSFEIPLGQIWHDAHIESGPGGYPDGWIQKVGRPFLRLKKWSGEKVAFFALIVTLDESLELASPVRVEKPWQVPRDGELVCFANDVPCFYWNNRGSIRIIVRRVSPAGGDLRG